MTRRLPNAELIAHSDRGSQYASEHDQRVLSEAGLTCRMSRKANCWDNAPRESFFATLKKELVHHEDYATREQAKASIFESIEAFYNRQRRHSTLGYMSPADYEAANPEGPLTPCPFFVGNSTGGAAPCPTDPSQFPPAPMPYAASSDTSSNVWKRRVMRDARSSAWVIGTRVSVSSMAARNEAKFG